MLNLMQSVYPTIAAMKADPSPPPYATALGYYSPGDGGGGNFRWGVTVGGPLENGGTIFTSSSKPLSGQWVRVCEGQTSAAWFGVNPSQADNTQALQNAINFVGSRGGAGTGGGAVFIPSGYYRFTFTTQPTISIPYYNVNIVGEGRSTVLTVRSPSARVASFFTWSIPGQRGEGGGIREISINGNSQLLWGVTLDSWRFWEMSNVQTSDVFAGSLDAVGNQTTFGENIAVRHCDQKPTSGTNSCFSQYFIRFRAGAVGAWSDCSIRDCMALGVWGSAYVIDGCMRFTLDHVTSANNATSANTIDGTAKTGLANCVLLTNSVNNGSTTDAGYHLVRGVYHESHTGTERPANNVAVWIDTPANQTGYNRFNMVEGVAFKSSGAGQIAAFRATDHGPGPNTRTVFNTFRDCRAFAPPGTFQVDAKTIGTVNDSLASISHI